MKDAAGLTIEKVLFEEGTCQHVIFALSGGKYAIIRAGQECDDEILRHSISECSLDAYPWGTENLIDVVGKDTFEAYQAERQAELLEGDRRRKRWQYEDYLRLRDQFEGKAPPV